MRPAASGQAWLDTLWRTESDRCVSCGNCLYVCPVFKELKDETICARGRNEILKGRGVERDSGAGADPISLSQCLLCGRCSAICPQGVQHDKVVLSTRADALGRRGTSPTRFLIKWLLTHRRIFKTIIRLLSRLQFVLPKSIVTGSSKETPVIRHLPALFLSRKRTRRIPSIADRFLSERVPAVSAPRRADTGKTRIAYFAGCATEYIYPGTGVRLINLLNSLGGEVIYPGDLLCCGIPILASGDADTARQIARNNLSVLRAADPDYIVTSCATCGSTLRDVWPSLFQGREKEAFVRLSTRVKDVAELMRMLSGYKMPQFKSALPANSKVTYHYPCHSIRYQDASQYPVDILKQVFGPDYIEMENKSCCGCGGSFSVHHYELSRQIGKIKIDSISQSRADYVVTSCPGCMIQITDGLHRSGLGQRVIHLTEAVEPY